MSDVAYNAFVLMAHLSTTCISLKGLISYVSHQVAAISRQK